MAHIHLLVLIHGMWGNPAHLGRMQEIIQKAKGCVASAGSGPTELVVLVARTNRDEGTYDGIDWGGERVAEEVRALSMSLQGLSDRSSSGHERGDGICETREKGDPLLDHGIQHGWADCTICHRVRTINILRRVLISVPDRILHQNKFFEDVTPVNFNTIATPHVGIPSFPTAQSGIRSFLGRNFMSRTGQQFYCADKWSPNGRSLIEVLGDPGKLSALRKVCPLDDIVQNIYFTRRSFSSKISEYMRMRKPVAIICDKHQR